jgi:hypothetical protein
LFLLPLRHEAERYFLAFFSVENISGDRLDLAMYLDAGRCIHHDEKVGTYFLV